MWTCKEASNRWLTHSPISLFYNLRSQRLSRAAFEKKLPLSRLFELTPFLSPSFFLFFFFLSFVELGKGIINERKTISENVSFLDYSVRFSSSFSPSLVCRFTSSTRDAETFSNLQHSKATGSTRHSRSRRRTRSRRHSRSRRQTRSRRCTGRRVSVGESQSRFPLVGLLAHAGPTFLTKINGRLLRQEQGVCRRQF